MTPAAVALAIVMSAAQAPAASPACDRSLVRTLVSSGLRKLVGDDATLDANVVDCTVADGAVLDTALPEAGARFGRPVRFRLMQDGRQRGYATVTVTGVLAQVRTARPVDAGTVLQEDDLRAMTADATGELIERLPDLSMAIGARAIRALTANEIVTTRTARVPPPVRSGDRVAVTAVLGGVVVTGVATAQQSGQVGDVIRLVNADSRRVLRARITGKGSAEVMYGS
jgi:flagella basal body P-ring formation protein FlgA